jgi:hypothetical protein
MRRCLGSLPTILLTCGATFAQNAPVSQPVRTLTPVPPYPQSLQPFSSGNPFPQLTPVAPLPMPGMVGVPAVPMGQPVVTEGKDPTPAPAPENLVSFDSLRVDLSWANNHWQLKAGDVVLKDFGRRELEARQALRLIHELHLTQRGTVGSPNPVMEYWLNNGRAPQGLTAGMRTVAFDAKSLSVAQEQGQWVLRDPQRVLFNFGQSETEARLAHSVVQKYGFTQLGLIGQAAPLMIVFMSPPVDRFAAQQVPIGPQLTHQPPHHLDAAPKPATSDALAKLTGGNNTLVTPTVPPLREPSLQAQGPRYPFTGSPGQELLPAHQTHLGPEQTIPGFGDLNNKVPFDWRQVKLVQEGVNWKLKVAERPLADFGADRLSAERALAAVHYYHFTEQCLIGGPQACFSFYLVNGKAPQGTMLGAQSQVFQPEALQVKQIGPRWAVVANDQPLVQLRDKPEEAKQLLEAIQRNHFDRLCRVGPDDDHGLTFFVRSR